jgi:fermentation-respiration switch protein FrsA (DUF1100 family)
MALYDGAEAGERALQSPMSAIAASGPKSRQTALGPQAAGLVSATARSEGGTQTGGWTITNPLSFMNMPILSYIKETSPQPILFVHGENAHSRYFSETAYAAAAEPKELVNVPGANHTDLYDRVDVIPFDRFTTFFQQHLAAKASSTS